MAVEADDLGAVGLEVVFVALAVAVVFLAVAVALAVVLALVFAVVGAAVVVVVVVGAGSLGAEVVTGTGVHVSRCFITWAAFVDGGVLCGGGVGLCEVVVMLEGAVLGARSPAALPLLQLLTQTSETTTPATTAAQKPLPCGFLGDCRLAVADFDTVAAFWSSKRGLSTTRRQCNSRFLPIQCLHQRQAQDNGPLGDDVRRHGDYIEILGFVVE